MKTTPSGITPTKSMLDLRLLQPSGPVLTVGSPPHVHRGVSVTGLNARFLLGLLPVALMACATYGMPAARVLAAAGASAVLAEHLFSKCMKEPSRVHDLHSLTIGLVLACFLPASAPWWLAMCGAAISVLLGKMIFGGLGAAPLAPAMVGWAVCRVSWPHFMSPELTILDTALDPVLFNLHKFGLQAVENASLLDMLAGRQLGFLGASQTLAALAGGTILLATGRIRWEIPAGFLGGVLVVSTFLGGVEPTRHANALVHLLGGSTVFAAFFAATDDSSSPSRKGPMLAFGALCGLMTVLIRTYGIYPDGTPFAILVANLFAPALAMIRPKPFGKANAR